MVAKNLTVMNYKELEHVVMQRNTVVIISVGRVNEDAEKSVSSETGICPAEGGATASVGESGQEPG